MSGEQDQSDAERDLAEALRLIEALIFASPDPLTEAQIQAYLPVPQPLPSI